MPLARFVIRHFGVEAVTSVRQIPNRPIIGEKYFLGEEEQKVYAQKFQKRYYQAPNMNLKRGWFVEDILHSTDHNWMDVVLNYEIKKERI